MADKNHPVEAQNEDRIALSPYSNALLQAVQQIQARPSPDEFTKLTVSRAVSFVALVYERMRNAIEYREEHLIRRAAIERILRRRLSMNPDGEGEGESLLRELLWARYFPKNSLGEDDVYAVQHIITRYIAIRKLLLHSQNQHLHEFLWSFLVDMLSCEIEETLSPDISTRESIYTHFIFQTLHKTVRVDGVSEDHKDMYLLIALEKAYRKSDRSYQRYHTFILFYQALSQVPEDQYPTLIPKLTEIFKKIDIIRKDRSVDKLVRYIKKQLPPYLILFEILNSSNANKELLTDKAALREAVEKKCKEKYAQIQQRLTSMAVRSLIYIFITKMLVAIILEYPVSIMIYGEAQIIPIIINSLFPPFLMIMIVLWFKLPDEENTKRIYHRIVQILDADKSYEDRVNLITRKPRKQNPVLSVVFSVFYITTFVITLALINYVITLLDFHLLSKLLFIFFVSVVSFFAYRIKQVVNEYWLVERDSILTPIIDFFFIPILSLGKVFSKGVSRLNFFTILFDFIIEAPFKMIIDVVEEWIKFVRARKDEIV
jgi:hypothetical protein